MVSGRAILARMEGEFTRLSQIYGNLIIFYGVDGDKQWENRSIRFLKPLLVDEVLKRVCHPMKHAPTAPPSRRAAAARWRGASCGSWVKASTAHAHRL